MVHLTILGKVWWGHTTDSSCYDSLSRAKNKKNLPVSHVSNVWRPSCSLQIHGDRRACVCHLHFLLLPFWALKMEAARNSSLLMILKVSALFFYAFFLFLAVEFIALFFLLSTMWFYEVGFVKFLHLSSLKFSRETWELK